MVRLIGSVFVYRGVAWQTFGYDSYRPLGSIRNILKIYDRHGVDEIIVSVRSDPEASKGPDLEVLEEIRSSNINTPVVFSGGISSIEDVRKCLLHGVERVGLNACLYSPQKVKNIVDYIGVQGVIAVIPFVRKGKIFACFNSSHREFSSGLDGLLVDLPKDIEFLLHDADSDGSTEGFSWNILPLTADRKILLQGGVLQEFNFQKNNFSGIVIENRLLWSECVIQKIKDGSDYLHRRI